MTYITRRKRPVAQTALCQGVGLGTALLTGLMASTAGAAEAQNSQADSNVLTPISVSATTTSDYKSDTLSSSKFAKPVAETPQTIQIINKDLIQDQGATTLTEALQNSAGVGTFYAGENGNTTTGDSVYMRGFDSSSSIFVDGVRDLGSVSRDTFNLEQIEVIKGPAGTDYGRTAPSGSINLSTKQAFMANRNSGSVQGGTDGQKRATLDLNRKLTDNVAGRLNLMGQDSDVAGRDEVNNSRWGVAPALTIELDEQSRLYLNYLHVTQNNVPDGGVATVGLPGYATPDPAYPQISNAPRVDTSNFYGVDSDHDDVDVDMATAIFEYDMSPTTQLRNTLRWGRTEQDYMLSAIMAVNANGSTNPDDWTVRRLPNLKNQTNTIITNQTGLVTYVDTGKLSHTFSYGVELTREKVETTGMARPATVPDANLYNPDHNLSYSGSRDGSAGKGTTDTVSAYLFDAVDIGSRWQLNAGVRLDHYKADYKSSAACTGGRRDPDACAGQPVGTVVDAVNADTSDTLFNWKLGALYKINPQLNVYADYAVSAQPPGGNNLELSDRDNSADNPNFDPQEAQTAELGTKWTLANNKLLLSAAVYRTTVTNLIEEDPSDGTYHQTGEKQVEGVELSAVGNITENWNVSAGFTTMDATIEDGEADAQDESNDLTYTPDKAFTSWTTYRLPFNLTIGGGARYTGGLKRGSDGAVGTPEYTDSYWVFDAMASYPLSKNADLQLNVYNVFDKDYVASINKSGYRYNPGTPLSALLTLNVKF
ncbi:catecholate siderophore receptor Fiu [Alcanivorax hongdengensis A-11-3]|uniref:Catecholate siderophore receptor Fiu n=1 Tax=Alcanivorax hongdengensis A-11-3 TaxID=1177179 RepID=L0WEQ0_9GAMM|nr:catecholate siderophore receptor Fiu [Alcanivorax hongdengensis]EKF75491.1 catecholate siderophore receptor Fiu [Alcanivorax hongdengensis A-11-3]